MPRVVSGRSVGIWTRVKEDSSICFLPRVHVMDLVSMEHSHTRVQLFNYVVNKLNVHIFHKSDSHTCNRCWKQLPASSTSFALHFFFIFFSLIQFASQWRQMTQLHPGGVLANVLSPSSPRTNCGWPHPDSPCFAHQIRVVQTRLLWLCTRRIWSLRTFRRRRRPSVVYV